MGITTVIRKASFLRCEWVRRTALAVALGGMFAAAPTQPASAQTYTWSGTNALWNTTNWITSSGTTTFPGGSSGTNTAIINSGTVSFAGNDTFGNSGNTSSPVIRIGSGGTLASGGFFNSLWNVNLPDPPEVAGLPEIVDCPVDASPFTLGYRLTDGGWHYAASYHERPRTPEGDVAACFGGAITVSRLGLV